jgi:SAM-dependent methyltransferase
MMATVQPFQQIDAVQLVKAVTSCDWNFADSSPDWDAHNIHPFPAKFVPQIPRQLLSIIDIPERTAVLDPFCGSGTTLLEACLAGKNFVGVDLNPIAILISRVKTAGAGFSSPEAIRLVVNNAKEKYENNSVEIPDIPKLDHWFKADVAKAMASLTWEIEHADVSEGTRDFLRLSLSSITVKVSNQDSETRYAAISKAIGSQEVFKLFERSGETIAAKLQRSETLFGSHRSEGKIILSDARNIGKLELPKIGLVITSPPYPNAYEYWLYNKYRMYFLGHDPIAVREKELGARPHYSGPNGHSIERFICEMQDVFVGISKHLIPNAKVALLVSSESRIRGEVFPLPRLLDIAFSDIGYKSLTEVERQIPRTRKTFNPDIGSIESETLMFFEWSGFGH